MPKTESTNDGIREGKVDDVGNVIPDSKFDHKVSVTELYRRLDSAVNSQLFLFSYTEEDI